jgi:hypothetical protein
MEFEEIEFFGHPNIKSTHRSTLEITKEETVSFRGDCIIGVKANKSCAEFNRRIKKLIANDRAKVKITIYILDKVFEINAEGSSLLALSDDKEIVVRKSNYISPRTLAINSDKVAVDIPREIVRILQKSKTKGKMLISVKN